MKVNDIYQSALSLMSETPEKAKGYENLVVPLVNILIADLFDLNNDLRINNGKAKLTEIPLMIELNDDLNYETMICRDVLPNGLAAKLLLDDDLSKAMYFENEYNSKKYRSRVAIITQIEDVYR